MKTEAGTRPDHLGPGEVGDPDRDRAVGVLARRGRHALPHLPLHHDQQVGHRGHLDEGPQHQGRGHVVGQVGHQAPRTGAARSASSAARSSVEGVALDHLHPGRLDHRAQHRDQVAVGLHRHHPGPGLGQGQGQGPEAGPDLEHLVAGPDAGQAGDAADRVGVSDEVLPEGPAGPQPVRRQQLGDVGAGMGHQEIVTSTTPWLESAICEKPSGDRSTTRG